MTHYGDWTDLEGVCMATIREYGMVASGDRVLLAVSGGADSMALMHAMAALRERLGISLQVAHVNHMIRGAEADADEEFVMRAAAELGLEAHSRRVDVPALARARGMTVEEAGRQARYEAFEEIAREHGMGVVALAHNANDNAETVLMRIIRGTGVKGLAGIPPTRVTASGLRIVRPLINVERRVIEEYCGAKGIAFRTDSTNVDTAYTRNRVRNELIPLLEREYNPAVSRALVRLARNASVDEDFLAGKVCELLKEYSGESDGRVRLSRQAMAAAHDALLSRALMWAYGQVAGSEHDTYQAVLGNLVSLVRNGKTGDSLHLPGGVRAWLEPYEVVLELDREEAERAWAAAEESAWGPRRLAVGAVLELEECGVTLVAARGKVRGAGAGVESLCRAASEVLASEVPGSGVQLEPSGAGRLWAAFDAGALDEVCGEERGWAEGQGCGQGCGQRCGRSHGQDCGPSCGELVVRPPRAGDWLEPFGLDGSKKLSDLFTDEKVPRRKRQLVPVVEYGGHVLFVAGLRASGIAPVTDATSELLVIALKRN